MPGWTSALLLLLPSCLALHTREPVPPPVTSRNNPTEHWLNVRVNHFDASNTDTFPMRFYYNDEFGGPNVVILVGGEWSISAAWTQAGLAHELAGLVGAGVFYTEHRYYGQTRPSKNASVVLVGCSYAGSMATWMRLAYPHLVDAAFSDSGPLHAQEDFPGKNQTRTTTPLDLATFFWFGITESFAYLVQYATPGQIPSACAVLSDTSVGAVQRLANWISVQPWTQPCIETRYSEIVLDHTNTSYNSPQAVMRLWTYQTCVEYGWYQTTSSSRQPFLSTVPLDYFHQMCKDFFSNLSLNGPGMGRDESLGSRFACELGSRWMESAKSYRLMKMMIMI
ncbi:putative serine protease K12H4.7 [Operophtera brumata]|uniref:Putative serine protease K12H4.7 n=1 Tax=Operophtera brumata TaxID=104452 RepID=A0A0L7L976_OPEBR|nr:putative serine protease K12H4.7 [Operophtera brumata]